MQSTTLENSTLKNTPLDIDKWREIINAWNPSTESQKEYCHRLGISLSTFGYVKGKLLKKSKAKTKFIPVSINSIIDSKSDYLNITFENKNGMKLHIPFDLSSDQLPKIIKILGW